MKEKLGKKRIEGAKAKHAVLKPFEDLVDLTTLVRIQIRSRHVSAYLLKKGKNRFCFVFGFECRGVHSYLRADQVDAIFDNLEAGLKDLPPQEYLTIHLSAFSSDRDRQQQLQQLVKEAPAEELQFLLLGERARIQELTQLGVREPKFLRLYATYTVEPTTDGSEDLAERTLARMAAGWRWFKDEGTDYDNAQIKALLMKAFTDGFLLWEQLLSVKMGLLIQPLDEQELWSSLWSRMNSSDPVAIPQLLVLDQNGLREEIATEIHSTTLLQEKQAPVFDRQWVRVKDRYIGALTFLDKPGGWASKASQLRYLWDILARDVVVDTEIFCQLMPANPLLVKTSVQRLIKQSNVSALVAQEKRSIDVGAQVKTRRSVSAQEQLYEGALPIYTSVVILVHRAALDRLDEACRYIESCFRRPAWVVREREYAWKIWLQTLPIVWEGLMTKPFNRRQVYLSGEVPGLAPLMRTRSGDSQGFELIGDDGGTPIFLDLFTQHKNLGLFATTRAGKSVLVSGILTQALAHGMPVVALDYPKPDGTSTFTDYTEFMGANGAYFDISRQANNLLEMPDLRSLPIDKQAERFYDYKDFLASALMTLVLGEGRDPMLGQTMRAVVNLALNAFFNDPLIQQRYQEAIDGGFGSLAWQETPTLHDFIRFCVPEHLPLEILQSTAQGATQGNVRLALQQIQLRLQFWLGSRVGRAIAAPSSFPTNAALLVFALRNLSDNEDAAILSLSAYSAALRRALESSASIFFIDESPILFRFPEIAKLVGGLCANGAKSGIRVIISGQDPNTIANSATGSQIFQNLSTRLIGRIQPAAISSFLSILEYPRDIISNNATESFFPKKQGIFSRWLLDEGGVFTLCRYYPAYVQLAAVANNPEEQAARTQFLRHYPDKYEAIAAFAKHLVACIRNDRHPLKSLPAAMKANLSVVKAS
jgi:hypothetical protein